MGFKKTWGFAALAAAALLAGPALAQESWDEKAQDVKEEAGEVIDSTVDETKSDWEETRAEVDEGVDRNDFMSNLGFAVGGGLNNYTGDLGDITAAGGSFGVVVNSQPLNLVGFEVGYEGSRNPFEDINGGALMRHNVGGLAKVGPTLGANDNLRPFVGAGLGLSVLNPNNEAEPLIDGDFVAEVPVALGLEYKFGALTAGGRATYRFLAGEDAGINADGNIINLGINVGGSF
jgi:opacity protein-like surface antigen